MASPVARSRAFALVVQQHWIGAFDPEDGATLDSWAPSAVCGREAESRLGPAWELLDQEGSDPLRAGTRRHRLTEPTYAAHATPGPGAGASVAAAPAFSALFVRRRVALPRRGSGHAEPEGNVRP